MKIETLLELLKEEKEEVPEGIYLPDGLILDGIYFPSAKQAWNYLCRRKFKQIEPEEE